MVLASYPSRAGQLKKFLAAAVFTQSLPQPEPRHVSIRTGMNTILSEMDVIQAAGGFRKLKPHQTPDRLIGRWLKNLPSAFLPNRVSNLKLSHRLAILALVVIMSGGFLTLTASASGLSRNVFTNLWRGLERVRTALLLKSPADEVLFENEGFPTGNQADPGGAAGPEGEGTLPAVLIYI